MRFPNRQLQIYAINWLFLYPVRGKQYHCILILYAYSVVVSGRQFECIIECAMCGQLEYENWLVSALELPIYVFFTE